MSFLFFFQFWGHIAGRKWKESWNLVSFEIVDYGIPGENVEEGKCTYLYASKSTKSGTFNSPHHPVRYPDNTNCRFIFRPEAGEQILISFYTFFLGDKDTAYVDHCLLYYYKLKIFLIKICQSSVRHLLTLHIFNFSRNSRTISTKLLCSNEGPCHFQREIIKKCG